MSDNMPTAADFFAVIEPYNNYFALTKNSSLIGAIEISGRDPDGLSSSDQAALCAIAQSIYGTLDRQITITEYYAHFDGVQTTARPRANAVTDTLSKRRVDFLNSRNLAGSRLVHYFEIDPEDDLNKLKVADFFKHLGLAVFEQRSRLILKNAVSTNQMFVVELEQLSRLQRLLQDAISEVTQKWSGIFTARQLTLQEMWAHMRFLATMDPGALTHGLNEGIPEDDMDICLTSGDVTNVQVSQMEVLKLPGVVNRYVKVASVRRFSRKGGRMQPGLWSAHEKSPCRVRGNYVIMTRWRPMTEFKKELMFSGKNRALERESLNFFNMLTGMEAQSHLDRQASLTPVVKEKMEQLGIAENLPDAWGLGSSFICVFGANPDQLRETATDMNVALGNAKVNVTWESVSIQNAFAAFQPGQGRASDRDLYMPSSQFAAASLILQSSVGQPIVKDLNDEEACYQFQSKDGSLFHYSPFINGRSMVIGVGPIRKGKTFTKNTLATHSQKYGGLYRAIDIDPGTEPIAGIFGADAGIFRASGDSTSGANPFVSCRGKDDVLFKTHMLSLLKLFLETNDTPLYRSLSDGEQEMVDAAITKTIALPEEMQSLSTLVAHMPEQLKVKFARWVKPQHANSSTGAGWYAHLFDCQVDAIGKLDKRMGVYNLMALKETPHLLRPVLADILYRVTQAFEDPARRAVPKTLDIDECHHALQLPGFADYIVSRIRTWGKWFGTVQLWTQSVEELMEIKGWGALRSAASTFMFFSDPEMDEKLYRKAFPFLTAGECEAIRGLVPQKQAYIIQPEVGVSKVIIIDVEPAQRVANTSHPREAALRDGLIAQYGFEAGMAKAVEQLEGSLERDPEDDIHSRLLQAA